jgi:hypothetical protein
LSPASAPPPAPKPQAVRQKRITDFPASSFSRFFRNTPRPTGGSSSLLTSFVCLKDSTLNAAGSGGARAGGHFGWSDSGSRRVRTVCPGCAALPPVDGRRSRRSFPRQREGAVSPRIPRNGASGEPGSSWPARSGIAKRPAKRGRGATALRVAGGSPHSTNRAPAFLQCGRSGRAAVGARGGIRQRGGSNCRQLMDTAATVRTSRATGGGLIIIGLLCDPVRDSNERDGSNRPASSDQPETLRWQGHNVGR